MATNCFAATPTGIISGESCLPPISPLITHRPTLAALRALCSPPSVNPATARLHPSFPSLPVHRGPDSSRAIIRGLLSVHLPLHWKTPRPVPPIRKYLLVDAVAHRTLPFTLGLSRVHRINCHLFCTTPTLPPQALMENTYSARKKRIRETLLMEWVSLFPTPGYYLHPRTLSLRRFMGLGKFLAGRIHQMRAGKGYLATHPT